MLHCQSRPFTYCWGFTNLWMWPFRFKHYIRHQALSPADWIMDNGAHSRACDWTETLFPENKYFFTTAQPLNTETFTLIEPILVITDRCSTHLSAIQLPASQFNFISFLLRRPNNENKEKKREQLISSQCKFGFSVSSVLKCCQSAHVSRARRANRINPGLTPQACEQGNGLC